jgi:Domain of unknown function (DUF4112)
MAAGGEATSGEVIGRSHVDRFHAAERRILGMSHLLDELVRIPGTNVKAGLDPLIGLIPVVGDIAAAVPGGWLIVEAWRFGIPHVVVGRMVVNWTVDLGIGAIPLIGDVYDLFFRSNRRNLDLFRRYALEPETSTRRHRAFFLGLAMFVIGFLWLCALAVVAGFRWLAQLFG